MATTTADPHRHCPRCKKVNPPDAKVCGNCGKALGDTKEGIVLD